MKLKKQIKVKKYIKKYIDSDKSDLYRLEIKNILGFEDYSINKKMDQYLNQLDFELYNKTISDFVSKPRSYLNNNYKNKLTKYWVLIAYKISFPYVNDFPFVNGKFSVPGIKFSTSLGMASNIFDYRKVFDNISNFTSYNYLYITAEVFNSIDKSHAVERSLNTLSAYFSVWNFLNDSRIFSSWSSGIRAKSRALIPNFTFALVKERKNSRKTEFYSNYFEFWNQEQKSISRLKVKKIRSDPNFDDLLKILFKEKNNDLNRKLLYSLQLYQDGLLHKKYSLSFMDIWKAIEVSTGSLSTLKIEDKLKVIQSKLRLEVQKDSLNLIKNFRNRYTHEGIANGESHAMVDCVRWYSLKSIFILIYLIKNGFKDEVCLDLYYRNMLLDDQKFKLNQKMINTISK